MQLTGYDRHYGAWLLRNFGRERLVAAPGGTTVRLLVGRHNPRRRSTRRCLYDRRVRSIVLSIWDAMDQVCGKRLVAILPTLLPTLLNHQLLQRSELGWGERQAMLDRLRGREWEIPGSGRGRIGRTTILRRLNRYLEAAGTWTVSTTSGDRTAPVAPARPSPRRQTDMSSSSRWKRTY